MALQFWRSRHRPAKRRLLTWRGGYHGDTFWAMSVCDPDGGMHRIWDGVLPGQVFADRPPAGFAAAKVAPAAARYDETLGEFLLPHDAVRTAPDPDAALLAFLHSTYDAAADLAHWDGAAVECEEGVPGRPRPVAAP